MIQPARRHYVSSELDKPIIAAINGDAIDLAARIALLSDILVMAEEARIGDTHVSRVGLVAGDWRHRDLAIADRHQQGERVL